MMSVKAAVIDRETLHFYAFCYRMKWVALLKIEISNIYEPIFVLRVQRGKKYALGTFFDRQGGTERQTYFILYED